MHFLGSLKSAANSKVDFTDKFSRKGNFCGIYAEDFLRNLELTSFPLNIIVPLTPHSLWPESIFINDDLPAPDGPNIAVILPDSSFPHIEFIIVFCFLPKSKMVL